MSGADRPDSENTLNQSNNNLTSSSVITSASQALRPTRPPIVPNFVDAFNQRLGLRCKDPDFPPSGPRCVK